MSNNFFVSVLNYIFWAPGLELVENKNDNLVLLFNKGIALDFWAVLNKGKNPEKLLDIITFLFIL